MANSVSPPSTSPSATFSRCGKTPSRHGADLLLKAGIAPPLTSICSQTGPESLHRLQDEGIKEGFRTITEILGSAEFSEQDVTYLLEQVHVVRTELPSDTDLNHYFEIMNSRGEQLEKHEIVKAKLMGRLDSTSQASFATIWDACSGLSKFVQAKFGPDARGRIFGERWEDFLASDFSDLQRMLTTAAAEQDGESVQLTRLTDIVAAGTQPEASTSRSDDGDESGRYGSIIDFSNFLLHALKVHRGESFDWASDGDEAQISLDDKQLIEQFETLRTAEDIERFGYVLLRLRYLFDRYVIKTDKYADSNVDDSNWVLQRVRRTGNGAKRKLSPVATFDLSDEDAGDGSRGTDLQRQILMAQAMFQVTDSRRSYKNFLFGILTFLFHQEADGPSGAGFAQQLQTLAAKRYHYLMARASASDLDRGTSVPHFVFNYLDYVLWHRHVVLGVSLPVEVDPAHVDARAFRFRYRTSVEHFYPQHVDESQGHEQLGSEVVDQFGNLCLMTRSDNSGRSNLMPDAKIRQYDSSSQSLKFQFMAALALKDGSWRSTLSAGITHGETGQIERHGQMMRDVLAGLPQPG